MEIEYDIAKDAANRAKHGLSLEAAKLIDWGSATIFLDDRFDYGEVRSIAYGYIDGRLMVCVHTMRGGVARVISLRKANKKEQGQYG